uniref:Uncharacterized protein n=1 Tax=Tetranychus urticae TaxID=32264 RepID=T1JRJ8_TETUR
MASFSSNGNSLQIARFIAISVVMCCKNYEEKDFSMKGLANNGIVQPTEDIDCKVVKRLHSGYIGKG